MKGVLKMLTKPVTINKQAKKGVVDGYVYVICKNNGHILCTMNQYGKAGSLHAAFIRDAINKRIRY